MPSSERDEMRKIFFDAWNKYHEKRPVEPLEADIIAIILRHPEYHDFLNNSENLDKNHFLEQNPFLHMSLHLALQEQINTNRPAGIKAIYTKLCSGLGDKHSTEHKMIDCLATILWDAQQNQTMPDEKKYLEKLREL